MKWNAELYENFGKERLQPAIDLVNRIPDGDYKRIVDIGCGSGMSTFPLRQRFSEAEIIGVDSSCEMLEKANGLQEQAARALLLENRSRCQTNPAPRQRNCQGDASRRPTTGHVTR